jgi:hypothetical protein
MALMNMPGGHAAASDLVTVPHRLFRPTVDETGYPIHPRFFEEKMQMGGKARQLEQYGFVFLDLAFLFLIRLWLS